MLQLVFDLCSGLLYASCVCYMMCYYSIPMSFRILYFLYLNAYVSVCALDMEGIAQRMVRFELQHAKKRLITDWISGTRSQIYMSNVFTEFLDAVSSFFEMETTRIYALCSPSFSWTDRILINEDTFEDYYHQRGRFAKPTVFKLYVH